MIGSIGQSIYTSSHCEKYIQTHQISSMAAPMNWNAKRLRNPGNAGEIRHPSYQSQMFDFQRPPQNQFIPRMSPRQQFVQQFTPGQLERPNFTQFRPNNMMPNTANRFQGRVMQQNEHHLSQNNELICPTQGDLQDSGQGFNNQRQQGVFGYEHQNPVHFQQNQTLSQSSFSGQVTASNFQSQNIENFSDKTINTRMNNSQTFLRQTDINLQSQYQLQTGGELQAQEDQQWLRKWLQAKYMKTKNESVKSTMKICEAQEKTRQMMVLLARLQKNKQMLETLKHEDKSIWDQKLKEVLSVKDELECVQKELTNEENVKHLKARVEQRKKKRERLKQHKEEMYRQHEEDIANRERRNAELDKAMQQLVEKQKLEKQEKDMQKEADEILSQVRKKLTEANKSIQVITSLQKLRKLRNDRLERQGVLHMYDSQGHSSTNRLMFEAKISNLTDLLNKQLDVYKAEEAALKVHLETEQEETREKEREKARLRMIEKQKQERKKEEKMLFGNQKDPIPGDPLYPFRQYYDSASHSIEALITIRREWDSCLTTPQVGTCIPDEWVCPPEPSSDIWATALESEHAP